MSSSPHANALCTGVLRRLNRTTVSCSLSALKPHGEIYFCPFVLLRICSRLGRRLSRRPYRRVSAEEGFPRHHQPTASPGQTRLCASLSTSGLSLATRGGLRLLAHHAVSSLALGCGSVCAGVYLFIGRLFFVPTHFLNSIEFHTRLASGTNLPV
jgi:hypothetical protein